MITHNHRQPNLQQTHPFSVSWDITRRLLIDAMWICADTPIEDAYDELISDAVDREAVLAS